ncbi:hypothetical protein TSUD_244890 [Trifolium subterraneum]|uniref:Uncharacterized protein n=1 Tax=Trifolium subterraneum TaxID=3900 RepID=A0A2Z6N9J1_TRISU|nr:hypothetical protein TSUD_244890 [Trifolium subterraneum]
MLDNTLPILSFHLNCVYRFYFNKDFYDLLDAAITRGVENVSIDLPHCSSSITMTTLPTFILTTKTLSVLKLKRVKVTLNEDDDPDIIDLPSLKVLHLESVGFTHYQHIMKLLSGCPILEELEAKDLTVYTLCKEFPTDTDVPSLSNLVRANISDAHIEFDWLHNIHHLRTQLRTVFHLFPADGQEKLPYVSIAVEWMLTGDPLKDESIRSSHIYASSPDRTLFKALQLYKVDVGTVVLEIINTIDGGPPVDVSALPDQEGVFSVKSPYDVLAQDLDLVREDVLSCLKAKQICHSLPPSKVVSFSWQLLHDRTPTRTKLSRRSVTLAMDNPNCAWCPGSLESAIHLLLHCDFAQFSLALSVGACPVAVFPFASVQKE